MEKDYAIKPFRETLGEHGLTLTRGKAAVLQVNVGLLCNQTCGHCHLNAGPGRTRENMDRATMDAAAAYARVQGFETIDITGGAPEMNPHLPYFIEKLARFAPRIMLRCNLSALHDEKGGALLELLAAHKIIVIASMPSFNAAQTDSQRGRGSFAKSIAMLRRLNELGYGREGPGLELNLVSNPAGAFLPPSQAGTEKRFREVLKKKWGVEFNNLFNFANAPLGRFRAWLARTGNLEAYMQKLAGGFNPCSVEGLMCRTLVSVSWDGYLYDCDFNLAAGLPLGGKKMHISELDGPPPEGIPISVADYCYTCTAGAGFT